MKRGILKTIFVLSVLLVCFMGVSSNRVQASPANSTTIQIKQPSGQTFKGKICGDEKLNWVSTETGFILIQDTSGYWNYAINKNNMLISSGYRYMINTVPAGALTSVSTEIIKNSVQLSSVTKRSISSNTGNSDFIGNKKVLVLLVEFTDVKMAYSDYQWNCQFFSDTQKSVRDYYKEVSFSKCLLSPVSETYGIKNDGVIKVSLNHPHPNDSSVASVKEALTAANQYVDFASYDTDGNGEISNDELMVCIVYAGYEKTTTSEKPSVWGSYSSIRGSAVEPLILDGKLICGSLAKEGGFSLQGERHESKENYHMATIGVLAHEIGHEMGLPDLYIDNPSVLKSNSAFYTLMACGNWSSSENGYPGDTPVHLDAWSKVFLGFAKPTEVSQSHLFAPVRSFQLGEANSIRKIFVPERSDEYFLVENRQPVGYDKPLYSALPQKEGGILIWHVKSGESPHFSAINVETSDMWGATSAHSTLGNNRFNQTSLPNSNLYDGQPSHIAITVISKSAPTMWIKESIGTQIDTQTPTKPLNLRVTENSASCFQFQWDASSDNRGIQEYEIYRDDNLVCITSATKYTDTQFQLGVAYKYKVIAIDTEENASVQSDILVK